MKPTKLLVLPLALLLGLMSCKKDKFNTNDNPGQTGGEVKIDAKDLVVPAKFNFETEKELTLRVGVANPSHPGERFVIKIYTEVPAAGNLVATGITDASTYEYSTTIRVASYEDYIYIQKINENGSSEFQKVKANKFVKSLFTGKPDDGSFVFQKSGSGMTCSSGCTSTVNNLSTNDIVTSGNTVCYTGNITGSITVRNGGTAKICGSGSLSGLTIEGNGKVYILEGAILNLSNLNCNSGDVTYKSWSDSVTTSGTVAINGDFYNYGKMYVNGDFNVNSSGDGRNYGEMYVSTNFSNSKKFKNYHFITVNGTFQNNSNGDFENYCFLWVKQNLINSNEFWNNCFVKVGEKFTQNSTGQTKLDDGGIIFTKNLTVNKKIEGTGTNRSKVKVSSNTTINSSGEIKGKIDLCDSNGVETNNGNIASSAALDCSGYIAPSTCFPDGYGQPTIQDADSDGVADSQDEYPNDPTRAFTSYYPSATTTATLAFEDLWPGTGDYDYNDLVLSYNITKVLNADNKVVDYKVKLKVRAIGASYDNGFGFQLDELLPSDVATITGQSIIRSYVTLSANKTEASQAKAVIICYDTPEPYLHRAAGSFFNTIQANGTGTSDTVYVNVNFSSPVVDTKLSIDKFNPFIITNQRRDYEVHLGNFRPTDLAATNLFGTQQDRTNVSNSVYYKTGNGMPWAIALPADFVYPVEKTAITTAYNFFDDWAVSGGTSNTDWYTSNPGNRNNSSLYTPN
jgi:LruC domain-containing protein